MKNGILISSIAAVIVFCSCQQADNATGPSTAVGKFVVDTIRTTVTVKTDTVTNKLAAFIGLSLVYHFEYSQGTLDKCSLLPAGSYGMICYIDYLEPETAYELHRFKMEYGIPDELGGIDSIKFVRQLSGVFCTKNSKGTLDFTGEFLWKDSLFVLVKR